MDRTWHFHCCGLGSIPGQELRYLKVHNVAKKKKKKLQRNWSIHPTGFRGEKPFDIFIPLLNYDSLKISLESRLFHYCNQETHVAF